MTLAEMLADLPTACNTGAKRNAKGHVINWTGYKLHIDTAAAAAQWVRDEFNYFWEQGIDLPDAVVQHVGAMAKRGEYRSIEEARDAGKGSVPTEAILADRPIYKAGQILRPWQKRFVETCVEDFRLHGSARYLIADDVGLGKTLSMAAAALVLSMLDNRPVLILAPSTLIWQRQEELEDKLGIPSAVWSTQKKCWLDSEKRALTQRVIRRWLQNVRGASGSCRPALLQMVTMRVNAARWQRSHSASSSLMKHTRLGPGGKREMDKQMPV